MAQGFPIGFREAIGITHTEQRFPIGTQRLENGNLYSYEQADDPINAGQAVKKDAAASATGKKVTPTAAIGETTFGVSPITVPDEAFFWCQIKGVVSALVKDGTLVGDPLATSATAGVLQAAVEAGSGKYEVPRAFALQANSSGGDALRNVDLS